MLAADAPICFQSQYMCLLQITQSYEAPIYMFPAATDNTFRYTGAVDDHHWFTPLEGK